MCGSFRMARAAIGVRPELSTRHPRRTPPRQPPTEWQPTGGDTGGDTGIAVTIFSSMDVFACGLAGSIPHMKGVAGRGGGQGEPGTTDRGERVGRRNGRAGPAIRSGPPRAGPSPRVGARPSTRAGRRSGGGRHRIRPPPPSSTARRGTATRSAGSPPKPTKRPSPCSTCAPPRRAPSSGSKP